MKKKTLDLRLRYRCCKGKTTINKEDYVSKFLHGILRWVRVNGTPKSTNLQPAENSSGESSCSKLGLDNPELVRVLNSDLKA